MAARVTLCKALAAAATSASITIRLARPFSFLFTSPSVGSSGAVWTGTVAIQMSLDTPPTPNGGPSSGSGVTDANASWQTIVAALAPGDSIEWEYPLYRIRVNGANITGGTPDVFMLEQVFNPNSASDRS